MPVIISLLRGVNVGGHHKIKMDVLRSLCESLNLHKVQTYLQSGNVLFSTHERSLAQLSQCIETAIEQKVGFRPDVILRTIPELRDVVAGNPFAKRRGIEPSKFAVAFLAADPGTAARKVLHALDIAPEELHARGRELYIYFPNGFARPRLSWPRVDKILNLPLTTRNWNTVTKLLQLAESLQSSK